MKTFRITFALSLGLLLAGIFAGCADKSHVRRRGDGTITLVLQAPAMESGNAMRQMSVDQESAVSADKLCVLVFKTKGANGATLDEPEEQYAYTAKVASVTRLADKNQYEAKIRLKADDATTPYRLVLITNCDFDPATLSAGMTKTQVFASPSLKKEFTDKWPTDANARIPMWGESNTQRITENVTFGDCKDASSTNRIHLVRSLARVDVGLNFGTEFTSETATPNGQTPFKLQSVRVYRMANSFIIPGTQSNTFRMDGNAKKPIPVLPGGVQMAADAKPLLFDKVSDPEKATVREIYIPERLKGTNRTDRPCLVIGGLYGSDTKPTYYRLDFIKKPTTASPQDKAEALDILRNHRYRFNITKVTGPGSDSPEDALITEPINIAFDVVVWNDGEIGEVRYDGQYYLAVNKDKFDFGKSEGDDAFTVRTNWEKGYKFVDENGKELPKSKAEAKEKHMWYYLSDPKDPAFAKDQDFREKVFVLENATGDARSAAKGSIFVQAGRIKWPLIINQSNKEKLQITLYEGTATGTTPMGDPISQLEVKQGGAAKYVLVKYTKGGRLERRMMTDNERYIWTPVNDDPATGTALYKVELLAKSLPEELFTLSELSRFNVHKNGAEAEADLNVYNVVDNALPFGDKALTWNLTKKSKTFTLINKPSAFFIKASAPYKLEIVSITLEDGSKQTDKSKVVHDWTLNKVLKESQGQLTGERIPVNPYDYINGESGITPGDLTGASVKLRITSTDPARKFEKQEFTLYFASGIVQPTANCYILKKDQKIPFIIPVSEQINKAADWYNKYEDSFDAVVEERLNKNQNTQYHTDGGAKLDKLDASARDWSLQVLWSTIDPTGNTFGIDVTPVYYHNMGQQNYMSVKPTEKAGAGSAVVACIKDGKIIWSWHIWVVDTYPWEQVNGLSTLPAMNRNLGAAKTPAAGNFVAENLPDVNEMGMYYQYGRKDPFFAFDNLTGGFDITKAPKIKYSTSQDGRQGNATRPFGLDGTMRFFRMKDLIRQPTKMAYRDAQNEYILEFGSRDPNVATGVPSSNASLAIWQGQTSALEAEGSIRMSATLKTNKTPFDPSPYGWKIPSAGAEANCIRRAQGINLRRTGLFHMGLLEGPVVGKIDYVANNNGSYLHLATRVSGFDVLGTLIFMPSNSWSFGPVNRGAASGQEYCPSNAMPIRPILNERESDYMRYTEEAFNMENR